MMKKPIQILIQKGVPKRRFTIEIECSVTALDTWKGTRTIEEFIKDLLESGINEQGKKMSE